MGGRNEKQKKSGASRASAGAAPAPDGENRASAPGRPVRPQSVPARVAPGDSRGLEAVAGDPLLFYD